MFDQLVNHTATLFNLSTTSTSALLRALLALMTNERTGGAEGFVDLFRRAGLGDVVTSWFGGQEGRPITASHLEAALGTNTLDGLAASSGMTRAVVTAVLTYLLPKVIGLLTPTGTLSSSSPLWSQVRSYVDQRAVLPRERGMTDEMRQRRWWWPWAAAAGVLLLGLLWMRGPAGTIDPQLTVSNTDGKITYSGVVRDEATRAEILSALRTTFGADNVTGELRINRNVKRATWLPRFGELLGTLKTPGVEFALSGNAIALGGWLSAADRQALAGKVRGILGAQALIGSLGDASTEAVRVANDKALLALRAIGTSGVSTDTVVQAMNLAVVNFSSGSAVIPSESLAIIDRSAEAIKRAPAGSTIEIGGHTDSTGDPVDNLTLSRARADAVKEALVKAGVPSSMLVTKGYGDTRPRATNNTEFGRFQNRRIEYRAGSD